MTFNKEDNRLVGKGPIAKNINIKMQEKINKQILILNEKDGVFFICDEINQATKFSGKVRQS